MGVLALAMVWFPPAAGVLETISLASAGAAAADDAILLASGHGSAETFVEDAVSVVPGGAAIGVGKAIKYAKEARVAKDAVEGIGDVATKATLQGIKATDATTKSSEAVNKWWETSKGYKNPPYKPDSTVTQFTVQEDTRFVRVYNSINSRQQGGWLMRPEDIKDLAPEQIRDKYALPQVPTHITDAIVPKGSTLEGGIANGIPGWGIGGGIQYDTMGKFIAEFVNPRPLK